MKLQPSLSYIFEDGHSKKEIQDELHVTSEAV